MFANLCWEWWMCHPHLDTSINTFGGFNCVLVQTLSLWWAGERGPRCFNTPFRLFQLQSGINVIFVREQRTSAPGWYSLDVCSPFEMTLHSPADTIAGRRNISRYCHDRESFWHLRTFTYTGCCKNITRNLFIRRYKV